MQSNEITKLIKSVFSENWKEYFLQDAVTGQNLTYEDFWSAVLICKQEIGNLGVRENNTVCLIMDNSMDLVILYFALLASQVKIVPVDPHKGIREIVEILDQVPSKDLIITTSKEIVSDVKTINVEEINKGFYLGAETPVQSLDILDDVDIEDHFITTFTSGSTGVPKGVTHSFKNLVLSAVAFRNKFGFGKHNIFYHNLPMTYMAGILNLIVLPFISGSKLVLGERFSVAGAMTFWKVPIKYSVNTLWLIPIIVSLLLKFDRGEEGIKYAKNNEIICCIGTAPLAYSAAESFKKKYGLSLYESYGLSETLFVTTQFPGSTADTKGVGGPLAGVDLRFENDDEIMIGVPWMFLGYLNAYGEDSMDGNMFYSGDMGQLRADENLVITGRKKDLIIKGGINISPKKVEDFIDALNVFEEIAVVGVEDSALGEKAVGFFVPKDVPIGNGEKKLLNRSITEQLGVDYRIDEFKSRVSLPKTVSGKIDKQKLKNEYCTAAGR